MTQGRGTYGPIDRDRNFVIGWAAERAVDHTVGAAVGAVLPAVDIASRAKRAGRDWWIGSRGLGGRDEAAKPLTEIGQELFHSVPDRTHAISSLSMYFRALVDDLATWQLAHQDHVIAQWIVADVTPMLEEWQKFIAHQDDSWWTKVATSWETYEEWFERLRTLRSLARAHGILLQSSEPVPLPKTIWQRGAEGKGSEAAALLGVLKIGIFAALTITGAVSMFAVLRDLRPRRFP